MSVVDWGVIRKSQLGDQNATPLNQQITLPVLSRGLVEFLKKADDPDVSAIALAKLIETDAALTCELLKHVNSSQFGLPRKASSAQQALSLLGIRQTKLLLIAAGARLATVARQSRLINLRNFWNSNLERALFAREIALLLNADADIAFAAGMLQDFLLPALTNEKLGDYTQFLDGQAKTPVELSHYERQKFGWTHAKAAASIMSDWGFPDDLVCGVLYHHHGLALLCDKALGRTAAAAVAVSSLIPDALRQVPAGLEQLVHLSTVWPAFDLERTARIVDEQFRGMAQGGQHEFSLLHRLEKSGLLATAS